MALEFKAFWLPKRGHSAEEYEDAFAGNGEVGCFAVADGASESSFAAAWAKLLVDGFVREPAPQPGQWADWLPPLQERWTVSLNGAVLPWYAEAKVEQGAYATFLGVVLEGSGWRGRSRWSAIAVGDTCFFQVRGGKLHRSFPMTRSKEFGNQPWLIGSRTPPGALLERKPFQTWRGRCKRGDRLWLTTDALAQWLLVQHEAGKKNWKTVERVLSEQATPDAFRTWIEDLRERHGLRNDDITFLAVHL
jgi:hypothetical protein